MAPENNIPVNSPAPIDEALIGEFLATLSRELRGPLAPLRASLELLKLSQPPGAAIQIMERQVGDLVRLVDGLTEMSSIAQGGVALVKQPVRLDIVLENAVEAVRPLTAASYKVRVTVSAPQEPTMLSADAARLVQLFGRLLSNAAEHSEAGAAISVEARREGADAIVRRLATLHDASVTAESDGLGKDSRFTVRLPVKAGTVDRTPVNILVVDDNRDAAESIGMLLGHLGAEVRVAEDGIQALAAFTVCRPNIVFLDIGMPGMDGYELARRMRAMPADPPVTLVALTGWGQDDDRKRVLGAGFDHHLVKPAQIGALQTLLDSMKTQSA